MKQLDKEQKDLVSILFIITFSVFLLIALTIFIYHPSHSNYLKYQHKWFFAILKGLKLPVIFIYNHLFAVIACFIPFSFCFKLFLGNKFYYTYNENLYPFRYLFLSTAFFIPLSIIYIYTTVLNTTETHFSFAVVAICSLALGYTFFAYFLRLQFSTTNQFNIDLHDRIIMSKKVFNNDYSLTLQIEPNHYVNIINPFRGIMIVGGPGSGKSFGIIEPIIDQVIHKNFTALIYDFKFPSLAAYAYAAHTNATTEKKTNTKFHVIYFRDPRYSNRCNPLDPKLLTEYATANQAASTILLNVNRTWAQKQGEFFSDSAIIILTAIIWYLRCKSLELNKNLCSLGHVIEFASFPDYAKTIEILTEHPEVKNTIVALQSAKQTGSMEQLGGQLGSLQIALSKLNDKKMIYVMSGNDFTLDINQFGNEQVVILGNDNEFKDTYAPALSLYAAITTRLINQQKRQPCALIVDEFPTMYIQNYEQLPATARSNKVSCIIAMQDFAQLRDAYGQSKEKTIVATHGNIFVGSTPEKNTAQFAAELIGKDIIQKKSYAKNEQNNYNISEQTDLIIYPHEIQQLNQGEFVGMVSDLDSSQISNNIPNNKKTKKVFAGKLKTIKPKHYYIDSSMGEFKNKIPKSIYFNTPEFNRLSEEEQIQYIDKITTDNITLIRNDTKNLIQTEFWFSMLWRFINSSNNKQLLQFIYTSYQIGDESTNSEKMNAMQSYIDLAIEEEEQIKTDPSRANELSKAVQISLQIAIDTLRYDANTFLIIENDDQINDY